MKKIVPKNETEIKAIDFKKGHQYAYIGLDNAPSEVGYVEVRQGKKSREYHYTGVKSGLRERCQPSPLSRFVEVKIID